jgi:acyl carrier protein
MSDTFDKVKEVIIDVMKLNPAETDITAGTKFVEDLGADSMDQFFLIDGFCEKFDTEIPDESAKDIRTVGDVVAYLDENL